MPQNIHVFSQAIKSCKGVSKSGDVITEPQTIGVDGWVNKILDFFFFNHDHDHSLPFNLVV